MKDEVADKCGSAGVYAVVAAAVITDKSTGRFLLCRRPESKADALLWEFPGGKTEKESRPGRRLFGNVKKSWVRMSSWKSMLPIYRAESRKGASLSAFFSCRRTRKLFVLSNTKR